ncbi:MULTISPECIES: DivIVA domain-containing protein [unclassified Arthrobacter]|uniref:DivIVA domain-containing protein n=1 Tax=unclassified Arthrobacter TaxID=235627 RepID=UPI0009A6927D|nr:MULTISPECIES: DivIVA domain-containing protein [unclassified Arthrobacter]MDF2051018.1 DivIVA domain-containing protein [Arthrobacter sp. Cr_A7]SLK06209.1 DivIVA domain-containing protein [Arthrobacter sp. P2b]
MSFFLVFLAIVLVGAVLWASLGRRPRKSGHRPLPTLLDGGFEQPPANLPPVLLPANAAAEDVDRVRFSLGLRGYRMDQVDQVLDELRDQLAARQQEVDELRARLLAVEEPNQGSPGGTRDDGTAAARDGGNAVPGKSGQ